MSNGHILKVSRLESLSDGVFAIAMTILVLNLSLPTDLDILSLSSFLLSSILLKLFIYIGSFIILGTLWVAMHFQMGLLSHTNRPYLWTHIFYLMIICIVPFSANLVAIYPESTISISFFAVNLLLANFTQFIILQFSRYYKLNDSRYTPEIFKAVAHRIFIAPFFYFTALLIAPWHTTIGFIVLILPILIYIFPGKVDRFDQSDYQGNRT